MAQRAAITVIRPREQVEHLWEDPAHRSEYIASTGASVRFENAPGDRGTEIHVELRQSGPVPFVGEKVGRLLGATPRARVMDELRRFKQRVETGVIARSEAVPEGELLQRKLKSRPAQPLADDELQKAGV